MSEAFDLSPWLDLREPFDAFARSELALAAALLAPGCRRGRG